MGGGTWTTNAFTDYTRSTKSYATVDSLTGSICFTNNTISTQDVFTSRGLDPVLNPFNVIRECCDSEEHPKTIPVILALDVTGSMGNGAVEVAKKINVVMTELYEKVKDVEFMIMGIGDLVYDRVPIQASQFESDIRIAEQLDKIYFEGGGGGNGYESYTAAWYFGLYHTNLDCWKRGEKGIIITMGDEPLNPYLPKHRLQGVTGDKNQADIETETLYKDVIEKFDIYHLAVNDSSTCYRKYANGIQSTFGKYLDEKHLRIVNLDNIADTIVDIVSNADRIPTVVYTEEESSSSPANVNSNGEIFW